MRKAPSRGARNVESRQVRLPPVACTASSMASHRPSGSSRASMAVPKWAILGITEPSSARAVWSSGRSMSGFMSIMAIDTPRPS